MIAEEIKVAEAGCCAFGACAGRGRRGALAAAGACGATGSTTVGLSGGFEEVDGLVAFGSRVRWCCSGAGGWLCGRGSSCGTTCVSSGLSLFLLDVLGDALREVSELC